MRQAGGGGRDARAASAGESCLGPNPHPQGGAPPALNEGERKQESHSTSSPTWHPMARCLQEAAHWAVFVADIGAAQKLPRAQKPGAGQWESGQHAERIALLRGYATGEASDGEKAKAIKTLNVSGSFLVCAVVLSHVKQMHVAKRKSIFLVCPRHYGFISASSNEIWMERKPRALKALKFGPTLCCAVLCPAMPLQEL